MVNAKRERRGYWLRGLEALQCGTLDEAVECFLAEGEACEQTQRWARAAIAWRTAASTVSRQGDAAGGLRLLRRAALASLTWAETSDDAHHMRAGFLEATRAFLAVGDLNAAKHALELAVSIELILADDRPDLGRPELASCASA